MIVTVTPNPSVDRTLEVAKLLPGQVLRATSARIDAGGKGVNVTQALVANGHRTIAVLPLGGGDGHLLAQLLVETGIPHRAVPAAATTRSNITVSEPDGTITKINAPGQPLSRAELDALVHAAEAALPGASWLVGCGSLPDGAPADLSPRGRSGPVRRSTAGRTPWRFSVRWLRQWPSGTGGVEEPTRPATTDAGAARHQRGRSGRRASRARLGLLRR